MKDVYIAPNATVVGDVVLEKDVNIWYGAVLRGDNGRITVGEGSNIQDNAVLHNETNIGKFCTIFPEMVNDIPLGDIVISLERAAKQGYEIGHSIYHEVAFLCVHSTLHLLGYDHETSKADEKEMFRKQKEIMEIMGF